MNLPTPLTADDLKRLKEQFPLSMDCFTQWLREVEKETDWAEFVNDFPALPHFVQLGVWIEFVRQQKLSDSHTIHRPLLEVIENIFRLDLEPHLSKSRV